MFDPGPGPRLHALPPGVDFPACLIDGLTARLAGHPPEAMARVTLVVNTRRMARRIRAIFDAGPPRLLPRVHLLTDFADDPGLDLPPAIPPLRRRLELARLVAALIEAQPDLAARSQVYDLADSLAALLDEMQGEGVSPRQIQSLDVTDLSGHWARAQRFFGIIDAYLDASDGADPEARQRQAIEALVARWAAKPPQDPIILAGSTGSRGTTLALMQAIAHLPQGAVVLPGYDVDQPAHVWDNLLSTTGEAAAEDHPQYRFARLLQALGTTPDGVAPWTAAKPPDPPRNRLISLALRPAPVTDDWLVEGPALGDLDLATRGLGLIEAPGPRAEAMAIALRMRAALGDGRRVALISPDRLLTRQVAAALDRWDITPDDSAGEPLHLSPPGRFLRHVAALFVRPLGAEALVTLLKHPLCHSGGGRGDHLRHARDLELRLRAKGPPVLDGDSLRGAAEAVKAPEDWTRWLVAETTGLVDAAERPLHDRVAQLRQVADRLGRGSLMTSEGGLWAQQAGIAAKAVLDALDREADAGGALTAAAFADLLDAVLSAETVRDRDAPDGRAMIWGTIEARVGGADVVILGGLNEGTWPEAARPDPWLNRAMRAQAGLLLPERRIGLSAHDFQQAAAAPEVWLTRSIRDDSADTVPSRWLNRLTNLLAGLPDQHGPQALDAMRVRGAEWLHWAGGLDESGPVPPARRPSPRPPAEARPTRLSVTEIQRLIRDPYAIYARRVLKLRPLDPLVHAPDALLRGIVTHEILEAFIDAVQHDPALLTPDAFLAFGERVLETRVAWPAARSLWRARLARIAERFVARERQRHAEARVVKLEADGRDELPALGFTLTAKADRVDRRPDGGLVLFDYKTGSPPNAKMQASFDKQLLLEAAMLERGAFSDVPAAPVVDARFLGLGTGAPEIQAPLDTESATEVWAGFERLIAAMYAPAFGFTARRMLHTDRETGDYDHLARFGEWDVSDDPVPEDLT